MPAMLVSARRLSRGHLSTSVGRLSSSITVHTRNAWRQPAKLASMIFIVPTTYNPYPSVALMCALPLSSLIQLIYTLCYLAFIYLHRLPFRPRLFLDLSIRFVLPRRPIRGSLDCLIAKSLDRLIARSQEKVRRRKEEEGGRKKEGKIWG